MMYARSSDASPPVGAPLSQCIHTDSSSNTTACGAADWTSLSWLPAPPPLPASWLLRFQLAAAAVALSALYLHAALRRAPPGLARCLACLPLVAINLLVPTLFDPAREIESSAICAACLAWLANNKVGAMADEAAVARCRHLLAAGALISWSAFKIASGANQSHYSVWMLIQVFIIHPTPLPPVALLPPQTPPPISDTRRLPRAWPAGLGRVEPQRLHPDLCAAGLPSRAAVSGAGGAPERQRGHAAAGAPAVHLRDWCVGGRAAADWAAYTLWLRVCGAPMVVNTGTAASNVNYVPLLLVENSITRHQHPSS